MCVYLYLYIYICKYIYIYIERERSYACVYTIYVYIRCLLHVYIYNYRYRYRYTYIYIYICVCVYIYIYIHIYIYIYIYLEGADAAPPSGGRRRPTSFIAFVCIRPIPLLTLSLLTLLDSNFPGTSLWTWEFHPFKLRSCLSEQHTPSSHSKISRTKICSKGWVAQKLVLIGSLSAALRFSKGWVRKDANLGLRTGCSIAPTRSPGFRISKHRFTHETDVFLVGAIMYS